MKKLAQNGKLIQKIVLSIIIVLLLGFAVPVKSQAGLGGILLDPLFDLLGTALDVVVGALQAFLVDGEYNNSADSGGVLNAYLVDREDFMARVNDPNDNTYKDFKYHTGSGEKAVEISEDELEKSLQILWWGGDPSYAIPVVKYTPEKIFSGLVPALDINFVNPQNWENDDMNVRSITQQLHGTIASWYVSLRNLAVVALMLVLVYVGIRIVISSTASDKAKYKQMLVDWLVALCILFCLHYIMTFTTTIVNEVAKAISGSTSNHGNNIAVNVTGTENGETIQFNTDIMGLIRFRMQAPNVAGKILYLILYLAMVIYTCMFTFYYLKRVLTIAFLTLISPLVAITYPIDKIKDGKAQAFDMWLKEYTFNALLQPFHLIIYRIFVGTAVDLVVVNPLFAIIALAFLTPAEKILRKFFGFEKAGTAGALGAVASAAGGAALMNQMKHLMAPKKGGGGGGNKGIRNKNNPEGSAPSVEEAFVENHSNSDSQEPQDEGGVRMNMTDTEFSDNARPIGQINPGGENLSGASSTDGMHMQGGLWVPNADPRITPTPSEEASSDGSDLTPTPSQIRTHGRGAFQWSEDDKRGAFSYLGGGIARKVGNVAAKMPGAGSAIRLGRKVSSTAKSIGEYQQAQRQKSREMMERDLKRIPKPIRNTASTIGRAAKGVGNVALQSGLAVGKAALKAAPGAMIGMAAGIAGDELSDIPKYTLAGAALSSTIGSSAVGQAGSFIANAYRQGSGSSYQSAIQQRQKDYIENNEELYRQKFPTASKKELKAKLEQGAYYDSVGIEGKDTLKAVKLEDKIKKEMEQAGIAEEDAKRRAQAQTAAIMKEVKDYSAKDLREESTVKDLRTDLSSRLESQGLRGDEKMRTIDKIVKEMKSVRGVKNDF